MTTIAILVFFMTIVFVFMVYSLSDITKNMAMINNYISGIRLDSMPNKPLEISSADQFTQAIVTTINKLVASLSERDILYVKSRTDALTGIANRYHLDEVMRHRFEICMKNRCQYGIHIIDIDFYKQYNDFYGHDKGDECLQKVAGLLNELIKENSLVARFGGDEFVIVYWDIAPNEIEAIPKLVKDGIASLAIENQSAAGDYGLVTLSQGLCYGIPEKSMTFKDFFIKADANLYTVKRNKRNNYKTSIVCE